jgi:hypothetical protein
MSTKETPAERRRRIAADAPRSTVLADVCAERDAQDAKWGGSDHDDEHMPGDWIRFIREHTARADATRGPAFREQLVRVAALAVAAIESGDRLAAIEKVRAEKRAAKRAR